VIELAYGLRAVPFDGRAESVALLDDVVGSARVVLWPEGWHHRREWLAARDVAVEHLVGDGNVGVVAVESSFTESFAAADYVRRGAGGDDPDDDAVGGLWSGGGPLSANRELLRRLRADARGVDVIGLDMCGARRGRFPHARVGIDGAVATITGHDAAVGVALERRLAPLLGRFASDRVDELTAPERAALATALADAAEWFEHHGDPRSAVPLALDRARHQVHLAQELAATLGGDDRRGAAQLSTLIWALERRPGSRVVVFAHVDHLDVGVAGSLGDRLARWMPGGRCAVGTLWPDAPATPVEEEDRPVAALLVDALADEPGPNHLVDLRAVAPDAPRVLRGYASRWQATLVVRRLTPVEPDAPWSCDLPAARRSALCRGRGPRAVCAAHTEPHSHHERAGVRAPA
jgi:hypothetical protein